MIFDCFISITYGYNLINPIAMKNLIVTSIILITFLSSCTKEGLDDIDYFAFGSAYGFCQGDCANFFIIRDDKIYPDDMDYYNELSLKFKSVSMSPEKYNMAKKLVDRFPAYLTNHPDETFGCPDCADQGGIHLEIKEKGRIIRWHFDTTISNLPASIQDYVREISTVIGQLK